MDSDPHLPPDLNGQCLSDSTFVSFVPCAQMRSCLTRETFGGGVSTAGHLHTIIHKQGTKEAKAALLPYLLHHIIILFVNHSST